jgi:nucleotide-binding universal stress UspA family protein
MEYRHVLIPLDGSEVAECVLPHLEAVVANSQVVSVELVSVVPPSVVPLSISLEKQVREEATKNAREYLEQVKSRLDASRTKIITHVLYGNVAETLIDYIKMSDIDLLIIAAHGRSGFNRWEWGSIADKILRSACIPVFLIRPSV